MMITLVIFSWDDCEESDCLRRREVIFYGQKMQQFQDNVFMFIAVSMIARFESSRAVAEGDIDLNFGLVVWKAHF